MDTIGWCERRIAELEAERDDWRKDRDRVIETQMPWMEMIEGEGEKNGK